MGTASTRILQGVGVARGGCLGGNDLRSWGSGSFVRCHSVKRACTTFQ